VAYDGNSNSGGSVPAAALYFDETLVRILGGTGKFAKADHVFAGWNGDNGIGPKQPGDTFDMPSADVTLTAVWNKEAAPIQGFTITFNPNGGSVGLPSALTGIDGKLATLPTPTRSAGYSFAGWYTAANGGTKVAASTVFSADATIYARWMYTVYSGGAIGGLNVNIPSC
jgi:uncharacterized repeat protein (TIGR02543 family)